MQPSRAMFMGSYSAKKSHAPAVRHKAHGKFFCLLLSFLNRFRWPAEIRHSTAQGSLDLRIGGIIHPPSFFKMRVQAPTLSKNVPTWPLCSACGSTPGPGRFGVAPTVLALSGKISYFLESVCQKIRPNIQNE